MPRALPPDLDATLRHLAPGSGRCVTLSSAITGEVFAGRSACTATDILEALHAARRQHHRWADAPHSARRRVLRGLLHLIYAHRTELLTLAQHTCALSTRDAYADLQDAMRTPMISHRVTGNWRLRPCTRRAPAPRPGLPVLSSFTDGAFPFTALLGPVFSALTDGSCVLTQVTASTAAITAYVVALARLAGLPAAAWQPVLGPAHTTYALLTEHTDDRLRNCCPLPNGQAASSSRATAPAMMAVRHDAQLSCAIRAALRSCFATAGRPCTSTPLVLVHKRHYETFAEQFTTGAARTLLQPPMAQRASMSPLAEEGQCRKLRSYIDSARSTGEILYDGGHRPDLAPSIHGPVVLAHPHSWTMDPSTIPQGPVAVIVPFSSWAEVLQLARQTGRHLGVHTTTPITHLAPQFATLPADDIHVNRSVQHSARRH